MKINWEKILLALNITRAVIMLFVGIFMLMIVSNFLISAEQGSIFEGIQITYSNHTIVEMTTVDSLVMVSDNYIGTMGNHSNQVIETEQLLEAVK